MKKLLCLTVLLLTMPPFIQAQASDAVKWHKYELTFLSSITYENPVQEVRGFEVTFTSPTGIRKTINGFWDGETTWKARFMPDETGIWTYETVCSDAKNTGLNGQKGSFLCKPGTDQKAIYRHGPVINPKGTFFLTHTDGTPFFWLACTAWNGALKSTGEEWDQYLQHRVNNNYTAIQLVTTQWRGCDQSSDGLIAFEGSGRIRINPAFFRVIDRRIDRVNEYGLVAAPVILWALQSGRGRELSPGYYLPERIAGIESQYAHSNPQGWLLSGQGRRNPQRNLRFTRSRHRCNTFSTACQFAHCFLPEYLSSQDLKICSSGPLLL